MQYSESFYADIKQFSELITWKKIASKYFACKEIETAKRVKENTNDEKTVAFFGDGTFKSTHRGKVAVPKKALLKVMAATGLTFLLGEYNTSKMCPCGTDELITPKGGANGKRVRVHKTSGDACSVLQLVDDRDETADVNFGLAALNSVRGYAWPSHLCSSCSATTWVQYSILY